MYECNNFVTVGQGGFAIKAPELEGLLTMRKEESQFALERQLEKFLTAVEILECRSDQGRFDKVLGELLNGSVRKDQPGNAAKLAPSWWVS
jgi:hypothetical protein